MNFDSALNKGSNALLNCQIRLLDEIFKDAKFTVSTYSKDVKLNLEQDVKIIDVLISDSPKTLIGKFVISILLLVNFFAKELGFEMNLIIGGRTLEEYSKKFSAKSLLFSSINSFKSYLTLFYCVLMSLLPKIGVKPNKSLYPEKVLPYYNADLILNTGGDVLTEDYITPIPYFSNIAFGLLFNKPTIIFAESIGPFKKKINRIIANKVFNRLDLITLREKLSLNYLNDLDVYSPPIHVTADVAFILEPISDLKLNQILKIEKIPRNKQIVGISVSKIISNYGFTEIKNPIDRQNQYIKLMAKISDYLVEVMDFTVVFVPHVYGPINTDDRIIAEDIINLMKNKDSAISIKNIYSPEELKGIIGKCDLFIGARMHATIASTSMGIPTVAIAYSSKTHGIIGEMLGYESYVLDVKDFEYPKLVSIINRVWDNKEIIKKELEIEIPKIKEKVVLNTKLIEKTMGSL